jgi:hypothetical protein
MSCIISTGVLIRDILGIMAALSQSSTLKIMASQEIEMFLEEIRLGETSSSYS